jgi:hypothetical protein
MRATSALNPKPAHEGRKRALRRSASWSSDEWGLSCAKVAGVLYLIWASSSVRVFVVRRGGSLQEDGGFLPVFMGQAPIVIHRSLRWVWFVGTLIMAVLFNFVVGITGGVEVDAS